MKYKPAILILLIAFSFGCANNTTQDNSKATEEPKVEENWSVRMANTVMTQHPELWKMEDDKPKWNYTYGLVSSAFLELWKETGEQKYFDYVKAYADKMIDENGVVIRYKKEKYNIDHINPGKLLFALYKETGDQRYKTVMDTLRSQIEGQPRTDEGGFWHKKRYTQQMWLDGLYMGSPYYAQYAQEFNEPESFDDIALQFTLIEEKTRDAETGLLYHGWDSSKEQRWANPETGCSPHFWGRAMGWYAMALVDVLDFFPTEHPKRAEIIAILGRLAEAITKVQDPETGLWWQVLDKAGQEGNYLEGSVSSMFSYALLKAVDKGYIDTKYKAVAEKAYNGIVSELIKENADGTIEITQVCAVAGLGGDPYRDGSYEYYVNERKRDNDPKAVGPFIMASLYMEGE